MSAKNALNARATSPVQDTIDRSGGIVEIAHRLAPKLAERAGAGRPAGRRAAPSAPRLLRRRRGRGTRRRARRATRAAPHALRRAERASRAARAPARGGRGSPRPPLRDRVPPCPRPSTPRAPPRPPLARPAPRPRTPIGRRRGARLDARAPRDRAGGAPGRAVRTRRGRAPLPGRDRGRLTCPSIQSRTARSESRRNGTSWQRERIVSGSGPSSSATSTMVA